MVSSEYWNCLLIFGYWNLPSYIRIEDLIKCSKHKSVTCDVCPMQSIIYNFRSVPWINKKGLFLRSFTQKCLKITLLLAKRALFCQIWQRAASDYQALISSRLFPAIPNLLDLFHDLTKMLALNHHSQSSFTILRVVQARCWGCFFLIKKCFGQE